MIELRALGTAEIRSPIATVTPSQSIVFAAALYLIIERDKPISRSVLSNLLWPDVASAVRGHRLRQTLHQLKKLGIPVEGNRERISLSAANATSDLERINQPGATDSSFEMLPGYAPEFSEPFADWVDCTRNIVHAQLTASMLTAIEAARRRADWHRIEQLSSKCLVLDPYNESAILASAEAAAMRGAKHQAVGIIDRFLSEVGASRDLRLPAEILRRRIVERLPITVAARQAPPFVGREREFEVLNHRVREARTSKGGAALITGEPGIGKSRLAAEVGQLAVLQGSHVQQISCRPADALRPLSLFVDLVPHLRELPGALGCTPATLSVLKRLTDFEALDDASRPTDSHALFGVVRAALFDLLESIAEERCVLVIVDDVQWLDVQSAKLLAQMAEWAGSRRVFFILTARPSSSNLPNLLDDVNLLTIKLGPLDRSVSTALLKALDEQRSEKMDSAFAQWCLSVAEGNPFFLQELLHQWLETGHKYEAPESVVKLLDGRMSRLSEAALQLLQTSALLGEHATIQRIQSILCLEPHQLVSAVEELGRSAMLRHASEPLGGQRAQIKPRHELIASSAINRLSPLSLGFLHSRAADVLERDISDHKKQSGLIWACASHSLLAGDNDRALSHGISCAEHLVAMGLAKESSEAFEKALAYCGSEEQRLRVLPRLAFSLQADGKWHQSKEVLQECISLYASIHPSASKHSEFEMLLLEARYNSSFDYLDLLNDLTPCVQSSDASASHRVRAGIHALKLATDLGPYERIHALYQHLQPLLKHNDVPRQDSLEVDLVYRTLAREAPISIREYREFLNADKPDAVEYFRRLLTVMSSCRLCGRYEDGLAFAQEAISHASARNLSNYVGQAQLGAVQMHVAAEQYAIADTALKQVYDNLCATENPRFREEPYYMEARIAIEQGDAERCAQALEKISDASAKYSRSRRTYLFALQVGLRILKKVSPEMLVPYVERLREAHEQSRALGLHDFEAHTLYAGLCACGREADARATLRDYCAHRRCAWPLSGRLQRLLTVGETISDGSPLTAIC